MLIIAIVISQVAPHSVARGNEVKGPVNTIGVVGSQVTLACVPTLGYYCSNVEWLKLNTGGNTNTVYQGEDQKGILIGYKDRFSIDNSTGCHLVIRSVQLTDAGRFACRVFISQQTTGTGKDHGNLNRPLEQTIDQSTIEEDAYLIVLKDEPRCSINSSLDETLDGDGVRLTCEVTYNGTNSASMVWKGVENAPAPAVVQGKSIHRSYSVVASAPEVPQFTCITAFDVTLAKATNIPITICRTSAIKPMHSVRDVKLFPSLSDYSPETVITCTAMGRPSPAFKWQLQDFENGGTWMDIRNQTSDVFAVSDASWSRRYRCVAMNVVGGKTYNDTSHEFQVNKKDSHVIPIALGVTFGVIVPTISLLIIVCFCVTNCPGYLLLHSGH